LDERHTSIPLDCPEVEILTSFPPTTLMLNYLEEYCPTIDGLNVTVIILEPLGGINP
jgi:hypothetical protein